MRLLPDTKRGEDAVQNVIGGGRAGNGIERLQRGVKIQQQHLMRDLKLHGATGVFERLQAFTQQRFMTQAGQAATFGGGESVRRKTAKSRRAVRGCQRP